MNAQNRTYDRLLRLVGPSALQSVTRPRPIGIWAILLRPSGGFGQRARPAIRATIGIGGALTIHVNGARFRAQNAWDKLYHLFKA